MSAPTPVSGVLVAFCRSRRQAHWSPELGSLLDFAEGLGIFPDSACRAGSCHSCQTVLLAGAVAYQPEPAAAPEAGHVLLCCARPVSELSLDL